MFSRCEPTRVIFVARSRCPPLVTRQEKKMALWCVAVGMDLPTKHFPPRGRAPHLHAVAPLHAWSQGHRCREKGIRLFSTAPEPGGGPLESLRPVGKNFLAQQNVEAGSSPLLKFLIGLYLNLLPD